LVHFIEELAEVVELPRLRVLFGGLAEVVVIDVAQGDEVFAGHAAGVRLPPTAGADDGEIELLVGRAALRQANPAQRPEAGTGPGRGPEELAAIASTSHGELLAWVKEMVLLRGAGFGLSGVFLGPAEPVGDALPVTALPEQLPATVALGEAFLLGQAAR